MRTTLTIDDDVLAAAKHFAEREQRTVGEKAPTLARLGLSRGGRSSRAERNGIPLLPSGKSASAVDLELVNQLCDERRDQSPSA